MTRRGSSCGVRSIVIAIVVCTAGLAAAQQLYAGRPLADALHLLQQHGLRIVYSSAVVTSSMRVIIEPRSSEARRVLDELLGPHGLEAKRGPGGVLQIVRAARSAPRRERNAISRPALHEAGVTGALSAPTYGERVVVIAPFDERGEREIAAESSLNRADFRIRTGVLANDPLAAMHSLPRVAATSDFRSDFSLRGSGSRHLGVVVDGVAAPNLQHAAYGLGESAALAMINPDVMERATVQAGAYPRRFGDTVGGQVALTLREGSRARTSVSGSIGGVSATMIAEGPLGGSQLADGRSRQARGSWLVSGRQSFLDWPTTSFAAEYSGMGFGFGDVQAKVVYDVNAKHQITMTAIAGHSVADNRDEVGPRGVFQGHHHASLATAGWRSTFGTAAVLQQRVYAVSHDLRNTDPAGATLMAGRDRDVGYRADVLRVWPQWTLEAGAQLQRRSGSRVDGLSDARAAAAFDRAGYLVAAWSGTSGLSFSPGVRVTRSDVSSRGTVSPWMSAEWKTGSGWTLSASGGLGHQLADLALILASPRLRRAPERARYLDFSAERQISSNVGVQTTLFDRAERDVLDLYSSEGSLSGTARGVEAVVNLSMAQGLTGSLGYSFGRTRYTDAHTGERFWGDFDQRHAINAFAAYRFSRTTIAAAFRSGTNFPIAGYFTVRDGSLFVGERRNEVRRPAYARFDVQGSRGFSIGQRQMTLVVEVLNILNRTNVGPANGSIHANGQAVGFTEKLLPRFFTAGLRVDF